MESCADATPVRPLESTEVPKVVPVQSQKRQGLKRRRSLDSAQQEFLLLESPVQDLKDLCAMYEVATKMMIRKNLYKPREAFKQHVKECMQDLQDNYLQDVRAKVPDERYEGENSSHDEEVNLSEPTSPRSSHADEEEPIYESMAPSSLMSPMSPDEEELVYETMAPINLMTPLSSQADEEESIYEDTAPNSLGKEMEDGHDGTGCPGALIAQVLTDAESEDSKCCLTCICVNIAKSEVKEEKEQENIV